MADKPQMSPEDTEFARKQDEEFAKAQQSMAGHVDADPVAPVVDEEEPVAPVVEAPTPAPEAATKVDPAAPVIEPIVTPEPTKPERPEKYIPLPKYHAQKKELDKTATELAEANKKIAELTALVEKPDGKAKDEDIEAFMEKTGFDRETVDGILDLAEKRLLGGQSALSAEQIAAVEKATEIVKEAELEVAFNSEFTSVGEPEIKKSYPDATPAQLEAAKKYLDEIAHTAGNKDKPLDFLIFKNKEEIAKLFDEPVAPEAPIQSKKTIESSRNGAGKPMSLTASDFKDANADFSLLNDVDQQTRSQIIKDMDTRTYTRYVQYAGTQTDGMEVMRNGQKVVLK